MTFKDARALAKRIETEYGAYCTVPYGFGPDGYFARIFTSIRFEYDPGEPLVSAAMDFRS